MSSASVHPPTTAAPATATAQWRDYFFRCLEHLIQTTADEHIRLQATLGGLRALAQIDAISQRNLRLAQHQQALNLARAHHQRMCERDDQRIGERDQVRRRDGDAQPRTAGDLCVSTSDRSPSPIARAPRFESAARSATPSPRHDDGPIALADSGSDPSPDRSTHHDHADSVAIAPDPAPCRQDRLADPGATDSGSAPAPAPIAAEPEPEPDAQPGTASCACAPGSTALIAALSLPATPYSPCPHHPGGP